MVMNVADALAAYKQGGNAAGQSSLGATPTGTGQNFSDVLKGFGNNVVQTLDSSEQAATAAATGKADMSSVVTAISNAELMLQTVVTIRDKVISAYQDITKTSI